MEKAPQILSTKSQQRKASDGQTSENLGIRNGDEEFYGHVRKIFIVKNNVQMSEELWTSTTVTHLWFKEHGNCCNANKYEFDVSLS